jgi:hypothetical protein
MMDTGSCVGVDVTMPDSGKTFHAVDQKEHMRGNDGIPLPDDGGTFTLPQV